MRVLLVGSYAGIEQPSMERFADLLNRGIVEAGWEVRIVRAAPILKRGLPGERGLGKWLSYIDRFLVFPFQLRKAREWADIVHICDHANASYISAIGRIPHLITCHDMLAIRSALGQVPENRTRWTGRVLQRWTLGWLLRAQRVVCVSAQTRQELMKIGSLTEARVALIPNALNYVYRPMPRTEAECRLRRLKVDPAVPFFIHVGGNQWYKNRLGALRIFREIIKQKPYQNALMLMVGKPCTDEMNDYIRQERLAGRVMELTKVASEDLCALYSLARALIFPSLQEGFGWPIIEAQASGCPVFTSGRAPMTEVGGLGAGYIDPEDPSQAAETICRELDARDWRRLGFENALKYQPGPMIQRYLEEYRRVLANQAVSSRDAIES